MQNHQRSIHSDTAQAQINAGWEGWFTPAQSAYSQRSIEGTLSGGKPPFLTAIIELELFHLKVEQ